MKNYFGMKMFHPAGAASYRFQNAGYGKTARNRRQGII
jgi:hypothetical protein